MNAASPISDARLEQLRSVADSSIDDLVSNYYERSKEGPGVLLGRLFGSPGFPCEHPLVAACRRAVPEVVIESPRRLERGQDLFDLFGPEMLLILGSCALPLAYAAGNGVQVVARARKLKEEPIRRLCDTAQMVINVMQPGEFEPGGIGWISAEKVRLIHALVRRHVQSDPAAPWDLAWGVPINQEDMAGTLLTFSVGVLAGLRKMGAHVTREQGDAYVYAWREVGRVLGVRDELLVSNEDVGLALALQIGMRQVRPTPEGRELAKHLLAAVESLFPLPGYAASLSHFLLRDSPFGANVIRALDLPEPNWTRWLVEARAAQKRWVLSWLDVVPGAKARRSYVARNFASAALRLKRPDGLGPFVVPHRLRCKWGLGA